MKSLPTTLPGVVLLELDVFGDQRGRFMETYRKERYPGPGVGLVPGLEPESFLEGVARERPTLSLVVPAVMTALWKHPRWRDADLSSLRAVGAGSSDVPVPLIGAFHGFPHGTVLVSTA